MRTGRWFDPEPPQGAIGSTLNPDDCIQVGLLWLAQGRCSGFLGQDLHFGRRDDLGLPADVSWIAEGPEI